MVPASSSVSPNFGMAVPGLTDGGSRIQRCKSAGPLCGTAPPAIVVRDPTPLRLGPMLPVAPGTPGMVWQLPQPFCTISCCACCACAGEIVGPPAGGALVLVVAGAQAVSNSRHAAPRLIFIPYSLAKDLQPGEGSSGQRPTH